MLNQASRKIPSIEVQQSSDLGISDAWVESAVVPDVAGLTRGQRSDLQRHPRQPDKYSRCDRRRQ